MSFSAMMASPAASTRPAPAPASGFERRSLNLSLAERRQSAFGDMVHRLAARRGLPGTVRSRQALQVASAASTASSGQGKQAKKREVLATADSLTKSHDGMRNLFEDLSLTVSMGDRVAIIGPNGSGKSSLLKIIAGKDDPTAGAMSRRKMLKVGMLEQEPEMPEDLGALEAVLNMDTPVSRAVSEYEAAVAAMERGDAGATERLNKCTVAMDTEGAWELAARAKTALTTLGMDDPNLKVRDMSGGQRRRVALASAMLAEPELMLLDEPTNHMDTDVIAWMMDWLERTQQQMAVVVVTHDRHFMETVCTGVLELDYDGSSHLHKFGGKGSYEMFHAARDARRSAQAAVAANAKNLLRKETEWMRRQPKARSTKSKARIEAFYDLTKTAKSGPAEDLKVDFDQGAGMQRQGKRVMELKDAGYSWGEKPIFKDLTYAFQRGEKIGIVGPNGCGKSTFLDVITGRCGLTEGSMEVGEKTKIGYFTQHPPAVPEDMRVADYLRDIASVAVKDDGGSSSGFSGERVSPTTVLDQVGFPRERQYQPVGLLSGGERRRLHLAATLLGGPNLLILDEPTNDLDLQTVEMLEHLLDTYSGVLVVVSHDFEFMENNCDRFFVFQGDGSLKLFDGSYSDLMELRSQEKTEQSKASAKPEKQERGDVSEDASVTIVREAEQALHAEPKKLLKLGYREKIEYEGLEAAMEELEEKVENHKALISECSASGDYARLEELTNKLAEFEDELEEKSMRWLELAERADIS